MLAEQYNSQSMTGDLVRVLVCPPRHAGWDRPQKLAAWRDLGFHRLPEFATGQSQHDILCRLLAEAGAEVVCLPPSDSLTLDAVYAHDSSLATGDGLILMNPGKTSRVAEGHAHASFCARLGIPVLGEIRLPGTS
jgi:N-dimethylarginine dimethylaminohydrolase